MTIIAIIIGASIGVVTHGAGLNPFVLNDLHGKDAHIQTHNQNRGGYDFPSHVVIEGDRVRLLK